MRLRGAIGGKPIGTKLKVGRDLELRLAVAPGLGRVNAGARAFARWLQTAFAVALVRLVLAVVGKKRAAVAVASGTRVVPVGGGVPSMGHALVETRPALATPPGIELHPATLSDPFSFHGSTSVLRLVPRRVAVW